MNNPQILCSQLIPAFFKKTCQGFHFIDHVCPLFQVCFVNLDVNKDESSTEHLQQVRRGTRARRVLITGADGTRDNQHDFICKGCSFCRRLFIWVVPWPLPATLPCLYLHILLSQRQGYAPSRPLVLPNSVTESFSLLSPSPLSSTLPEMTFPRFFQNLLWYQPALPSASHICCFPLLSSNVLSLTLLC